MPNIQQLIAEMTLEEKASLCSGLNLWYTKPVERLGIPSIMVTDGPHGLRKQVEVNDMGGLSDSYPATCFPTASALAATWDRELVQQVGVALGEECRQERVSVLLGPGANIKRSPLCGRNFEYFSEDPFLSGEIARSHILGVQSQGVGTSLKHFATNNQEYRRMTIDAVIDTRALHEIYLAGFEIAVRETQPWTIMGAYNRLNGTYCCENPLLLNEILRERWGFQGIVITDWGAMNTRVTALKSGLELEMPGPADANDTRIVEAVRSAELDISVLDQAAERILEMVYKAQPVLAEDARFDQDAHHTLARRVAAEGSVLLKNAGEILPLEKTARIALLGGFSKHPRYQGAGSSLINPLRLDNLHDEMVRIAGPENIAYAPGYPGQGLIFDADLLNEAVHLAQTADVVVVHVGLPDTFEVEGMDRDHLKLPESHNRLVEAICAVHDKVVVVLSNGAPVEMPWVDQVEAVLEGYLGGQAGGGGLADVLYGLVNPSGKLAETFPLRLEDLPCHAYFPGGPKTVEYRESLFVGYRFFETVDKPVLFPFGHGLSYTTFAYEDLRLSHSTLTDQETLTVRLTLRNTGARAGKEVVQVYINPESPTAFRPKMELKGFEKVALQPGESREVSITLGRRAFAHFSTALNDWQVEPGNYRILVGSSSRDIHLEGAVQLTATQTPVSIPERDRVPAYVNFPSDAHIARADFEALLGRPTPNNTISEREPATINTPLADLQHSFIARQLKKIVQKEIETMSEDNPDSPNTLMVSAMMLDAPLRTILMFGGDKLNQTMMDGLILMINRRFIKGLIKLVQGQKQLKS
ncbi:MAG TPA: glycoside hydrolase family 3 C-terminal domain-containing protein [Brevefilum sp.]|nr:glycoside hydrolase family 3 C-terminal domain-containing protein [Brevefilum sp.]HOR19850.1 glycoside hydrolase family 3 C-terminal domain-containing protein [Brevefilum sp.]HPL69259.1 glycoside hydrolase family 3 C-terminal domain-containing protein [Brevefilum sp.]